MNKRICASSVADYFLKTANDNKKPITNLKLQKLLYYANVWHCVFFNKPLFSEAIEAWIHGPAIPSVYRKFKIFESNPIVVEYDEGIEEEFDKKQLNLLANVWKVYGKYDAGYLEALTHSEMPWQSARAGLDSAVPSNNVINLSQAKCYYESRLKKSGK